MKIVHYSHQLGVGGTEKCMQYFLEYLHKMGHDCYALHHRIKTDAAGGHREKLIQEFLGAEKVIAHSTEEEFFSIMENLRPDIFHVHRSGRPNEFPVVPRLRPLIRKCVETNVFGGVDKTDVIDLTLYINRPLLKAGRSLKRKTGYLFYPVKPPAHRENMRAALGISPETFVMGRIGRPDDYIFDPISLRALHLLERDQSCDILYLVQSPPPLMIKTADEMGLKKIKFLTAPKVSDHDISSYFNTIDILAHARRDCETFGLNIAESMIHGKPVVSHRSRIANGHETFVRQCGYFAGTDNYREYAKYIRLLYRDKVLRHELGERGRRYATDHFLLDVIGQRLEAYYQTALSPKKDSFWEKAISFFDGLFHRYRESERSP